MLWKDARAAKAEKWTRLVGPGPGGSKFRAPRKLGISMGISFISKDAVILQREILLKIPIGMEPCIGGGKKKVGGGPSFASLALKLLHPCSAVPDSLSRYGPLASCCLDPLLSCLMHHLTHICTHPNKTPHTATLAAGPVTRSWSWPVA